MFLFLLLSVLSPSYVAILWGIISAIQGGADCLIVPNRLSSSDCSEIASTPTPTPAEKPIVASFLNSGSAKIFSFDALAAAPNAPTPLNVRPTVGPTTEKISRIAVAVLLWNLGSLGRSTPGIRLIVSTPKSNAPVGIDKAASDTLRAKSPASYPSSKILVWSFFCSLGLASVEACGCLG